MNGKKPYLICPTLIPQPTWGGTYIIEEKKWDTRREFQGVKIGQSYELYGKTWLDMEETDSRSGTFGPEMGANLHENKKYIRIDSFIAENANDILGPVIAQKFGKIPILIKFTQALGNSFQLHVRNSDVRTAWKPKPESWYYFQEGYITLGLNTKTSVHDYKNVCIAIDKKMHELSAGVRAELLPLEDARREAQEFIKKMNPWKFVNRIHTQKNDCIDLSAGGIHHSWEEDTSNPKGNIVYEVQVDVSDDESTLRSFDQGKIKDDGTIRQLTIDDYFTYINTEKEKNDVQTLLKQPTGSHVFRTPYYTMDLLNIAKKEMHMITDSFHHLYAREGDFEVMAGGRSVYVSQGHSCFIPFACGTYEISPKNRGTQILKTYVEAHL